MGMEEKQKEELEEIKLEPQVDTVSVQSLTDGDSVSGNGGFFPGLRFVSRYAGSHGWLAVEIRFDQLAIDGKLPKRRFSGCLGMRESKEFASELFDALCRVGGITSAYITKDQLRQFWDQITDSSLDTFFHMVDKNADGRITTHVVKKIITISASANKLSKIQERAEEYTALMMEKLDPHNLGYIELYKWKMFTLQALTQPTDINKDDSVESQLLSQELRPTRESNPIRKGLRPLAYFLRQNWKRIWIIVLWLFICTVLFTWKFISYKHHAVFHLMGYCVTSAKGAAETLKFNMALILLPVCRNTITWLRSRTKLGMVVPFDDDVNFHKVIAYGIAMGVGAHAILHLACNYPRVLHATDREYEPMKPFFGDERPNNYWWFLKGIEGWTGITMVVLMAIAYILAQPWFRRSRLNLPKPFNRLAGFNAFWYSHHLFIIVYVLFIIHGYYLYLFKTWYKNTTWMYVAIPMVLYAIERLLRAFRSTYGSVKILKVVVYRGNVLALQMSKPQGFKYRSGQYIFINCPDASLFQWHPFFITSAPRDDYISVRIATLGDWGSQLKDIFAKVCQQMSGDQSGLLRADVTSGNNIPRMPKLLIDGPYGAPTQDYKNYEVILLMGLGTGAIAFFSILKDVINMKQKRDMEEGTVESEAKNNRRKPSATNWAYFYWVTREQGTFEWFKDLMDEAAEYDKDGAIEIHNYLTSVYEDGDARSALITMLQSLHHAKNGVDIVSGTRVKTHFGRPNLRRVFKDIVLKHPNQRVGVFYCGTHILAGELKRLSLYFSRKTKTMFDFHEMDFFG